MDSALHPASLLLLPSPPQPPTLTAFTAAYREPIAAVLGRLKAKPRRGDEVPRLCIALVCPILCHNASASKTAVVWDLAQSFLSALYAVISAVCAQQSIAIDVGEGPGSVDATVLLIDHERGRSYQQGDGSDGRSSSSTVVMDLSAFAALKQPWETLFHPSSEAGYELLSSFLKLIRGRQRLSHDQIVDLPGGIGISTAVGATSYVPQRHGGGDGYESVCLGGTFDHLHPGHKLLLHATALLLCVPKVGSGRRCQMIVGVSGDQLLRNKKYASELQSWTQRVDNVLSFLRSVVEPFSHPQASPPAVRSGNDEVQMMMRDGTVLVRCVEIQDAFGPTVTEEDIDAIVVSGETRSGGQVINQRRAGNGWPKLGVYEVDVLDAGDGHFPGEKATEERVADTFAAKISSTAIRRRIALAKAKQNGSS